jgi:uncharacterized protein (TIGR00725 family)
MARRQTYVGVIGASEAEDSERSDAEEVGRLIAAQGAIVVCGGLTGVMEAACRGAISAGGVTVGLLPGTDRDAGNEFLSVALPTGLGELRNGLLVRASDAVIAIGGGWGTLSEIALALRTGVPVIGLGTWTMAAPGGRRPADDVILATTPAGAVSAALECAGAN